MQDVIKYSDSLLKAVQICLDKKLNFAVYRLPRKSGITLIIQHDQELQELGNMVRDFPEKGFLISPFSRETGDKTYLIRPDFILQDPVTPRMLSEIDSIPAFSVNGLAKRYPEETVKEQYIRQIEDIMSRINAGEFEKVVLSRIRLVMGTYTSRLAWIFNSLCETYRDAFVYLFCVKGNYWTGATPEPFICSTEDELCTVSLAGTRPFNPTSMDIGNWNRKELLELDYVTLHIEKVLRDFSVTDFKKNGPYATRAGNLAHLRTDFRFPCQSVGNALPSLINALHPTPAVCGMASGKAMDYIHNTEKHSREYYTGFLGPVGIDDYMQLYMNLRCMKILDDRLILYVGGGITHDSVPEEEWEETEIKADTLLTVLQKVI
jgi:isochorismate synthase